MQIYRARTSRDAVSLERDGDQILAVNELTAGWLEVQFLDGQWQLARPEDIDEVDPTLRVVD